MPRRSVSRDTTFVGLSFCAFLLPFTKIFPIIMPPAENAIAAISKAINDIAPIGDELLVAGKLRLNPNKIGCKRVSMASY